MAKTRKLISVILSLFMLMQLCVVSVSAEATLKLSTPTNFRVEYLEDYEDTFFMFDECTPTQYVDRYVAEMFLINDYTLFNGWHSFEFYEDATYYLSDLQDEFEWICEDHGFAPANTKLALRFIAVSNDQDVCDNSDYSPLIGIDGKVIADSEIKYIAGDVAGDSSFWKISSDGVLTVSGSGEAMVDVIDYDYLIKKIIIEEGITSISISQQTGYWGVEEIIVYGKNLEIDENDWGELALHTHLNKPVLYAPADSWIYAKVMDESDENHTMITVLDINDLGTDFRKLLGNDMADAAKVISDLEIIPQLYTLRNKNVTKGQLAIAMTRFEVGNLYTYNRDAGSYTDLENDTFETGCINRWIEYGKIQPNSATEYGRFDEVTYGLVIDAIKEAAPNAEVSLAGKNATDKVTYGELANLYYQAMTPEFLMRGRGDHTEIFKGSAEFFYDEYSNFKARLNGTRQGEFDMEGYENIVDVEYYVYDMDLLNITEDDDITLYLSGSSDISTGVLSTYDLEPDGYAADFTINGGDAETTNRNVSISLSATGYTKYKIEDGSYSNIPASPVYYTLDAIHGNKLINITFADEAGNTKTVTKSIKLNNMHSVTYMVDGKEFAKVNVGCGLAIPALEDEPVKAGFAFDGWDGLPPVMPDNDITVTATFIDEPPLATGTCGDSATWSLSKDGTLIISGTGAIEYDSELWDCWENIKNVVISEGITEIGDNAVYELYEMETISIPNTVTKIGTGFVKGSKVKEVVIPASVESVDMEMAFVKCPEDIKVYFMNKDIELIYNSPVGQYAGGIIMYGYADSTVQAYAENNYCTFVAMDPDFTINDGAIATSQPDMTIKFNSYAMDFEQYKINDGGYTTITGDTVTYTVDSADGEKEITVTFKKGNVEFAKTHKIIYDNKHSVIYKVNGETYKAVMVGCGAKIPAFEEVPTVEGYTFIKWDDAPEVMPNDTVVINAVLTKVDTAVVDSLLTEEEKAEGVAVNVSMAVKTENTNINTEITNNYSKYTASIILDITISKGKDGQTPTEITETDAVIAFEIDIPAEIQGKDEYIILREHDGAVDAITTAKNADGEYIVVTDKKITLYAKKFSDYMLLAKDAEKPIMSGGGGGGFSGYIVKFETNGADKIKSQTLKKNAVAKAPETPVKKGFVFGGWYTDKELTAEFDFATPITKSITLYAKWNEVQKTSIVLTIGDKAATINGETKENDVAPVIVNDRTMLPIRFIVEALGANVGWDEETRKVSVALGDITITVVIGESAAYVNGETVALDSPAFIENDRTYLPIRFIMENLGADVQWNEETRQVTITK